jgi:hypothetical protein
MGKKIGIRDELPKSFFRGLEAIFGFKILKFFDADPEYFLTLDPGRKNSDTG